MRVEITKVDDEYMACIQEINFNYGIDSVEEEDGAECVQYAPTAEEARNKLVSDMEQNISMLQSAIKELKSIDTTNIKEEE